MVVVRRRREAKKYSRFVTQWQRGSSRPNEYFKALPKTCLAATGALLFVTAIFFRSLAVPVRMVLTILLTLLWSYGFFYYAVGSWRRKFWRSLRWPGRWAGFLLCAGFRQRAQLSASDLPELAAVAAGTLALAGYRNLLVSWRQALSTSC